MNHKIRNIYNIVYKLFPEDKGKKEYLYVRRNWIFPNHIDVMLELAKELVKKYDGDLDICELAIILHDTGLVYKREDASPKGHEERSIEYSEAVLEENDFSKDVIEKVIECIKATEPQNSPKTTEEKIVRTVDAMSQFKTIHFFAKAAFSGDWDDYVLWLEKKVKKNFEKICFEQEKATIEPIRKYISDAIKSYKKQFVIIDLKRIHDKEELMLCLAEEFGFPGWWGKNWDALTDCLRSLGDKEYGFIKETKFPVNIKVINMGKSEISLKEVSTFKDILHNVKNELMENNIEFTYSIVD